VGCKHYASRRRHATPFHLIQNAGSPIFPSQKKRVPGIKNGSLSEAVQKEEAAKIEEVERSDRSRGQDSITLFDICLKEIHSFLNFLLLGVVFSPGQL
jgi:hypothetical protein